MTPQHFKEVLETICMTTGHSKAEISRELGVKPTTIWYWENKSFSEHKQPYVLHCLKLILREGKHDNGGNAGHSRTERNIS
jgi:hypothetical protein